MSEPTRVVIADHDTDELRTDLRTVLIQDRGRTRELRLRVARGVIKDIKPNREPRDGRDVL